MSRKKGPALYELISTNKPTHGAASPAPVQQEDEDVHLTHNVLTPGRSIRMSLGTIGVVVAVCIALIVISYAMGSRRGYDIARADYGNRLFEEINSTPISSTPQVNDQPVFQPEINQIDTESTWGEILSDPRVAGKNYFTLIQTSKEGAMQLAAFCRGKGLETYAISGNNTRLYRVIALPGSVDRNDAVATELRSKIHAIGQEWANTKVGRSSDLKDAYQSLYK
jgi:hypothetical protein